MEKIKNRFTSRKFIMAMIGVLTGVVTIMEGDTVAGAALLGASIIGYIVTEGVIDAKSAKKVTLTVADIVESIAKLTPNTTDDQLAIIIREIAEQIDDPDEKKEFLRIMDSQKVL